jgi:peroxiredoxin Q/BCP
MVSLDTPEKNRAFAESLGTEQVLLSDPTGAVAKAYGVLALGGLYAKRITVYIDLGGVVRYIDEDVDVGSAGQDIARRLGELGFPKRASSASTSSPASQNPARGDASRDAVP